MGRAIAFQKVKLFCGLIFRTAEAAERSVQILEERFSPLENRMETVPFAMTSYYEQEMGGPLFRQFVSFRELIEPEMLARIKTLTNEIEAGFAEEGRRAVNIDPGYLSQANIVIATTKNYYHRVPLQDGIYAHIELVFRRNDFTPLEWTYPDFLSEPYLNFFRHLRDSYRGQLKDNAGL